MTPAPGGAAGHRPVQARDLAKACHHPGRLPTPEFKAVITQVATAMLKTDCDRSGRINAASFPAMVVIAVVVPLFTKCFSPMQAIVMCLAANCPGAPEHLATLTFDGAGGLTFRGFDYSRWVQPERNGAGNPDAPPLFRSQCVLVAPASGKKRRVAPASGATLFRTPSAHTVFTTGTDSRGRLPGARPQSEA